MPSALLTSPFLRFPFPWSLFPSLAFRTSPFSLLTSSGLPSPIFGLHSLLLTPYFFTPHLSFHETLYEHRVHFAIDGVRNGRGLLGEIVQSLNHPEGVRLQACGQKKIVEAG